MSNIIFKPNKLYKTKNGCTVKRMRIDMFSGNLVFKILDNNGVSVSIGTEYNVSRRGYHPNTDFSVIGDIEYTNKRSRLY